MNVRCLLCHVENTVVQTDYFGNSKIFSNKFIYKCNNCSFNFIHPILSDDDLNEYNSSYFQNAHGGYSEHPLVLGFQSAINRLRAEYVIQYASNNYIPVKKVFEIGPGTGMFHKHFCSFNKTNLYSIVESDKTLHEKFMKMDIEIFERLDYVPKSSYDLVVCSHVLEHTNNPIRFIEQLYSLLSPKGILFIEVPCLDFLYKKNYEPHLLFFNKQSLSKLLSYFGINNLITTYHGPRINESKFSKYSREIKVRLIQKIYQVNKNLLEYFLPIGKDNYNLEELIGILPYSFLPASEESSWWIRAIIQKN